MDTEITTARLAQLFDTTAKTIADLGKREIIVTAGKKGRWQRDASITRYVRHLRSEAAGRGGDTGADVRARRCSPEYRSAQKLLTGRNLQSGLPFQLSQQGWRLAATLSPRE